MKIKVLYSKKFLREYKNQPPALRAEMKEKVAFFTNSDNHNSLKVHKLKGIWKGSFAFSVNYKIRVIFEYSKDTKTVVLLLTVGNHDIYK